jgi:uncharacterized membrane protein
VIHAAWPYLAVMLLCAGIFPALERALRWKLFEVLPPIVLTYLLVTALAVAGAWGTSDAIRAAQTAVTANLLPAMLFLLLATCDLGAVLKLGPRMLGAFLTATATICTAFLAVFLLLRGVLPADGWMVLAAVNGSWVGGTANLIAVKQAIGMPDGALAQALLMDTLCYSLWVASLFALVPLAAAFNSWTRARATALTQAAAAAAGTPSPGLIVLWSGLGLGVGVLSAELAALLPASRILSATSWKLLIATAAGLVVARTPLSRVPGSFPLASGLLLVLVAVMASQGSFTGLLTAPLFVAAGVLVLAIHAALLCGAARLFRFDLALCSVSSLANIGGVASAPLIAAAHGPQLVPVGVLLAMLGYVLGTGAGLLMAGLLSSLAPG